MDDVDNAAMGCATYLLFHPEDVDMLNNEKFFKTSLGISADKFVPHQKAVDHVKHLKEIKRLKEFIDNKYKRVRKASLGKPLFRGVATDFGSLIAWLSRDDLSSIDDGICPYHFKLIATSNIQL